MLITNHLNVQIAGDSHGPAIYSTIENFPFGFKIDEEAINDDLKLRQTGYGRGARMKQEHDNICLESGVWNGKTTGMPLVMRIKNRGSYPEGRERRTVPRPGHADYAAYSKFGDPDMRIYAEGASARRTAGIVATGSLCRQWLKEKGVSCLGFVSGCGGIERDISISAETDLNSIRMKRDNSPVFCPDEDLTKQIITTIDKMRENGDTLGGRIGIIVRGLKPGYGSFSSVETRLDALLAGNVMGIPSVKGCFIGEPAVHRLRGSEAHDRFINGSDRIKRASNNAGGIEGGISNGTDIMMNAYLKPIPSLRMGIDSVDVLTGKKERVEYVRSDVTAIAPAAIVLESIVSIIIADFFLFENGGGRG